MTSGQGATPAPCLFLSVILLAAASHHRDAVGFFDEALFIAAAAHV
jgi:hypothetical protein